MSMRPPCRNTVSIHCDMEALSGISVACHGSSDAASVSRRGASLAIGAGSDGSPDGQHGGGSGELGGRRPQDGGSCVAARPASPQQQQQQWRRQLHATPPCNAYAASDRPFLPQPSAANSEHAVGHPIFPCPRLSDTSGALGCCCMPHEEGGAEADVGAVVVDERNELLADDWESTLLRHSQMTLTFADAGHGKDITVNFRQKPLGILFRKTQAPVIVHVPADSYAESLGVRSGMRITAVNGVSVSGWTFVETKNKIYEAMARLEGRSDDSMSPPCTP